MSARQGRACRAAALLCPGVFTFAGPATGQTLTLVEAADAVLASHPTVAAAEARVLAAGEAGAAARAAWLPGAAVSATLTRFEEPMIVAPFHSLDFSAPPTFDRTLLQGSLGVQYTLFDGGVRSARIRGAEAVHDGAALARDEAEMRMLEETVTSYVGILSARAVLEAASARVEALEEEEARTSRELVAGTTAEVEVLRAAATLQEARAEEASARARIGLAERALARLMGVDAETISARPLLNIGAWSETSARDAAAASPLVSRAARAVVAAEARLAEERGGRLPVLEADAGLLDFGTISGDHVLEWQAGVQVSWPLFTGGARSAALRRASADLAAARSDLAATELGVAHAIDAARTSVVEADARAEALALAVAQWDEVARIEALALEAGSGVQSDLLRAQAGLFEARAGHAAARYEAVVARARLARSRGTLDRTWLTDSLEMRR